MERLNEGRRVVKSEENFFFLSWLLDKNFLIRLRFYFFWNYALLRFLQTIAIFPPILCYGGYFDILS